MNEQSISIGPVKPANQDTPAEPAVLEALNQLERAIAEHGEWLGQLIERIERVRRVEPQVGVKLDEVESKITAPMATEIQLAVRTVLEQTELVQRVLRELEI